jgi:hypothetical protein
MAARYQRVSIGFEGGQILGARLAPDSLTKLRGALGGDGWVEIEAEDGTIHIALDEVVYVIVDREEPRVGFGAGS